MSELRELLRQSRVTRDGFFSYELDELAKEIRALLIAKMPKNKLVSIRYSDNPADSKNIGFNSALAQMRKIIEEV